MSKDIIKIEEDDVFILTDIDNKFKYIYDKFDDKNKKKFLLLKEKLGKNFLYLRGHALEEFFNKFLEINSVKKTMHDLLLEFTDYEKMTIDINIRWFMKTGDLIYHKYLGKITIKEIKNDGIIFCELNNKVFSHSDITKNICSKEEYLHNVFDRYEFEKAYKYREIKYICHLTTIYNLINILKKGFFPRTLLSKRKYTNNL